MSRDLPRLGVILPQCPCGGVYDMPRSHSALLFQGAASESQQTFTTGRPLEQASLKGLLGALNCSNMESIDPNPQNIVAGINTFVVAFAHVFVRNGGSILENESLPKPCF